MRRTSPNRPFTIADAMILVAATAAGLALARVGPMEWASGPLDFWKLQRFLNSPLSLVLMMPTLAVIPIRLRRPRPSWPRLVRQPGFVAALAVGTTLVVTVSSWTWFGFLHDQGWSQEGYVARYSRLHGGLFAPPVGASWLALVLGRRWRPERGWIDRMGRALGWSWAGLIAFSSPFEVATRSAWIYIGRAMTP